MTTATASTTEDLIEIPERAFETTYTAVVFGKGTPLLDESFPTQSERRDAVVGVLRSTYDEVSREDVDAILTPFGGASADEALTRIIWLYADLGVDVHLGEHLRDVGPAVLYTAYTDYGDGTTFVEHYGSRQERLAELRQRAANFVEKQSIESFDNADETTCKLIIENAVLSANGCLHLFDARRQDVGGAYMTYASEA